VELSVVVPAYNEIERLPRALSAIEDYLREHASRFEIFVSDDGSTDGTADTLGPRFPHVTFLRDPVNRGKGAAVRRGMLAARGRLVLFSDADLSTPIEELGPMREALERGGHAIVIASRALPSSRVELHQAWWRETSGKSFNALVRFLSGLSFRDTQCGFKLFTGEASRAVFGLARSDGFAFDVEVLMIARALGLSVLEHPVRWLDAPGSKVSLFGDAPRMALDLVRVRLWMRCGRWAQRSRLSSGPTRGGAIRPVRARSTSAAVSGTSVLR
jgi:glycosyltransferase involved in cell wall biosynthesis